MGELNVAWVPVTGTWVRHDRPDRDPLHPRPFGARWQTQDISGVYLADSEQTAWAEWYRGLAEARLSPQAGLPRDLHRIAVDLERVADLSSESARQALALPRMRPSRSQWPAFQSVGEQLVAEGRRACCTGPPHGQDRCACACLPRVSADCD
jgi:hypothetical protein